MEIVLTAKQQEWLDAASSRLGRDKSSLVQEAIEAYAAQDWFTQAVAQARASADRGELLDHDDVRARLREWLPG